MKSNAQLALNQRVERITATTLVVGVDIAKEVHVGQAANFRGVILSKRPIRFGNSAGGFEQALRYIHELQQRYGMDDLVIGMESTGHYWIDFANWLMERGVAVVLVNPLTTSRNKENRDNTPSKSDPKDAAIIADVISRGYYTPYEPASSLYQQIRQVAKTRDRVKQDEIRVINRIHGWIDLRFPELGSVFSEIFCPRSLATLHLFPTPGDLVGMTPEDLVEKWREYGMSRAGGARGLEKATALLRAAKDSIGYTEAIDIAKWELKRLLKQYDDIQKDLADLDEIITKLLREIPEVDRLLSIGLTPTLCASLLGYGGELSRLDHGNQLLRKAGMNLAERSSGKYKGQVKLSKRGSSMLRKYLFLAVLHLIKNSPTFGAFHDYNVRVKRMKKMASMMKLMGKLARIMIAVTRKRTRFSADKLMLPAA